jgi:CheY-like chemotaxis protein
LGGKLPDTHETIEVDGITIEPVGTLEIFHIAESIREDEKRSPAVNIIHILLAIYASGSAGRDMLASFGLKISLIPGAAASEGLAIRASYQDQQFKLPVALSHHARSAIQSIARAVTLERLVVSVLTEGGGAAVRQLGIGDGVDWPTLQSPRRVIDEEKLPATPPKPFTPTYSSMSDPLDPANVVKSVLDEADQRAAAVIRAASYISAQRQCANFEPSDLLLATFYVGGVLARRVFIAGNVSQESLKTGYERIGLPFVPMEQSGAWRKTEPQVPSKEAAEILWRAFRFFHDKRKVEPQAGNIDVSAAKVLVVDDHSDNVELVTARLESWGYSTMSAADGQEALDVVETTIPDLILLDIMMPKIDGIEVARRIKANPDLPFIPIIMVTALDSTENKVEGLEAGADDYIVKPIDFPELKARVRAMLRIKEASGLDGNHTLRRAAALPDFGPIDILHSLIDADPHAPHPLGPRRPRMLTEVMTIVSDAAAARKETGRACSECGSLLPEQRDRTTRAPTMLCTRCLSASLDLSGEWTHIKRSISFPPEYQDAGWRLVHDFAEFVREQFPDSASKIRVEQEGLTVRLFVETPESEVSLIEESLQEYARFLAGDATLAGTMPSASSLEDRRMRTLFELTALRLRGEGTTETGEVVDSAVSRLDAMLRALTRQGDLTNRSLERVDDMFAYVGKNLQAQTALQDQLAAALIDSRRDREAESVLVGLVRALMPRTPDKDKIRELIARLEILKPTHLGLRELLPGIGAVPGDDLYARSFGLPNRVAQRELPPTTGKE